MHLLYTRNMQLVNCTYVISNITKSNSFVRTKTETKHKIMTYIQTGNRLICYYKED